MQDTRERLLRRGDYVFGSFLKPEAVDGYINGVNPGDRSDVLGRFSFSESSVDEAIDYAAIGARAWRRVSINDRATSIRKFRDHVARFQEKLANLVTREVGKPIWESRQEVLATIRALDLFLDEGASMLAPRVIEEIGARSDRLPRGVIGIICPYNFPVLVPSVQAAAALLAGNSTVVKPSKFTPGVGQALAELWDRCKLPRGVYNMVQGPGSVVGQRISLHPGVDVLSFGGTKNGCLAAEAIVFFDPAAAEGFPFLRKRAGQLLSYFVNHPNAIVAGLEEAHVVALRWYTPPGKLSL